MGLVRLAVTLAGCLAVPAAACVVDAQATRPIAKFDGRAAHRSERLS